MKASPGGWGMSMASALAALTLSGCSGGGGIGLPDGTQQFSFESDLQGWSTDATDVRDEGNPPAVATWSITRSPERARDGSASLKLTANNLTDAIKIWVERPFSVQPNTRYQVTIQFAFASADWGDFGLWRIIAGATPASPEDRDDLTFQGETGNGADADQGYQWLEKSYTVTATSGADGKLYVALGVWGTFEVEKTYYLDNVRITLNQA